MDALYANQFTAIEYPAFELKGFDGPYLSVHNNSVHILRVNERGDISMSIDEGVRSFSCIVDNEDQDSFTVTIDANNSSSGPCKFEMSSQILVVSDIEGNFNPLYSLLIVNGVMDENYQWTFEDGQLVVLGDLVDKGENVTQCLWLIYHLESQARENGGSVHFILGNHEIMDLTLDVRYVNKKCLALAQKISRIENPSLAYLHLMKRNNVLMDWVKGRNCMEQIGDLLFVHGGISQALFEKKLKIEDVNEILRLFIKEEKRATPATKLILGEFGPLWYRGMIEDDEDRGKVKEKFVDGVLEFYNARKIIIGHTVVDEVSVDYHEKVFRVDVLHSDVKWSEQSQGLLIDNEKWFSVNGKGSRKLLIRN